MQTLFRRLNTMFLQIGLQKNPALSPSHCPNSNLFILTIGTPIAHRVWARATISLGANCRVKGYLLYKMALTNRVEINIANNTKLRANA